MDNMNFFSNNQVNNNKNAQEEDLKRVKQCGWDLQLVKEQTPEICLAAMRNCYAFEYVKEQTPEICLAAVKVNGLILEHIKEQTPEICLAAVHQNGLLLRYVKEQTPEICLLAVEQNRFALKDVQEQFKYLFEDKSNKTKFIY